MTAWAHDVRAMPRGRCLIDGWTIPASKFEHACMHALHAGHIRRQAVAQSAQGRGRDRDRPRCAPVLAQSQGPREVAAAAAALAAVPAAAAASAAGQKGYVAALQEAAAEAGRPGEQAGAPGHPSGALPQHGPVLRCVAGTAGALGRL
eukprot:351140-Chlamydomonas_euryale.AAC.22